MAQSIAPMPSQKVASAATSAAMRYLFSLSLAPRFFAEVEERRVDAEDVPLGVRNITRLTA